MRHIKTTFHFLQLVVSHVERLERQTIHKRHRRHKRHAQRFALGLALLRGQGGIQRWHSCGLLRRHVIGAHENATRSFARQAIYPRHGVLPIVLSRIGQFKELSQPLIGQCFSA